MTINVNGTENQRVDRQNKMSKNNRGIMHVGRECIIGSEGKPKNITNKMTPGIC